jgi:ribosomal protein S18 acetylase RimI-like enzyme
MSDSGAFSWRPIEQGDIAAWAVMITACADADDHLRRLSEQDLAALFGFPDFDFPAGSIAVFDGTAMVAAALLSTRPAADPVHEMRFEGDVHPAYRRRGLGGQLLDWGETAAVPLHQKRHPGRPLTLHGSSRLGRADHDALFAGHGYRPVRWWHTMRMDLAAVPSAGPAPDRSAPDRSAPDRSAPDRSAPDGVRIAGFTADAMEDALQVRNEAFQDHWGSTETSAESWARSLGQESFRPEFSYIAYADGQALGIVISFEFGASTKATGTRNLYIGIVGTRRAGRKRGIASALLSRALADGKAAGFATSSLDVDGDSLTGAVGLYQRMGYTAARTHVTQAKDLITP